MASARTSDEPRYFLVVVPFYSPVCIDVPCRWADTMSLVLRRLPPGAARLICEPTILEWIKFYTDRPDEIRSLTNHSMSRIQEWTALHPEVCLS